MPYIPSNCAAGQQNLGSTEFAVQCLEYLTGASQKEQIVIDNNFSEKNGLSGH